MTKEGMINFGEMFLDVNKDSPNSNTYKFVEKALELLKQEPCEDCVDRKQAIRLAEQGQVQGFEWQIQKLVTLPRVAPARKKGRWIRVTETDFGIGYQCSECGRFILTESIDEKKLKDFPYCHCGAEMESEE